MILKKLNAVIGLLSVMTILIHIGYVCYSYLTFYYDPVFKQITAVPFIIIACVHAVLGMCSVFLMNDGTRLDLYPKQNIKTLIQRVTAALLLPLVILHVRTFDSLKTSAENDRWLVFGLIIFVQLVFYADALAHTAVSFSKGLITLGVLKSDKSRRRLDAVMCVLLAAVFVFAAFSVTKGELAMFLPK